MVAIKGRKSSNKNPPILSHEFVIQNHADIVSCVAMVFVIGLMMQVTSPYAYIFIALHHNATVPESEESTYLPLKYTTGWKDACAVFFYFLITIVMHAVVQEYIFDKLSKKLHLSKSKLSKFNESCQLLTFYACSAIWGLDISIRDNLFTKPENSWLNHPAPMSFAMKLFFISQFAYWLHCYPELYFQRTRKEDVFSRVVLATVGLFFTTAAYILNFQHVALVLLSLHFIGESFLHGSRLVDFFYQKEHLTKMASRVSNIVYSITRCATLFVASFVFIYGLGTVENSLDFSTGSFNIPAIRYSVFAVIVVFQAYLMYALIKEQIEKAKENAGPVVSKAKSKPKIQKKKESKKVADDDDLPEVDQATKKNLRSRVSAKAK